MQCVPAPWLPPSKKRECRLVNGGMEIEGGYTKSFSCGTIYTGVQISLLYQVQSGTILGNEGANLSMHTDYSKKYVCGLSAGDDIIISFPTWVSWDRIVNSLPTHPPLIR